MKLPDFIRSRIETILDEWEKFAKAIPHGQHKNPTALRDHARDILFAIADDLERAQSGTKSKDRAPALTEPTDAEKHGSSRFAEGFDVNESSLRQAWSTMTIG